MQQKLISRMVWTLSLVSLFTDIASEMLYPVMPLFLKSIGFSVLLIGLLEGVAEATAGLSKGYFGKLSDATGKRVPFVQLGYLLSAISKPLMAVTVIPIWILMCRTMDRMGKGIRTGARDALLSAEATTTTKASVFGFHRSMDTAGAVVGPTIALLFLNVYPGLYRPLFLIAFIPGIIAVLLTRVLKEPAILPAPAAERVHFFSFLSFWRKATPDYRKLVGGLLFFALINSSDVFLLLKIREAGLSDSVVIGVYIFYNLIYSSTSFPAGKLADRWGLKKVLVIGLILFGITYGGMAVSSSVPSFTLLFLFYGIYASCTEGIAKAWITNLCDPQSTATAIGTYTALQSVCSLLASVFAGWVWYRWGSAILFTITAVLAMLISVYFVLLRKLEIRTPGEKAVQR